MSVREELENYFPSDEVEELFAGCCSLYDALGDSYVDQNFEATLLHYKDTVQECLEYARKFEEEEGRKYDIHNADTFYEEEYLLKHSSGKEVIVHQLFQVYLDEDWEDSSVKLSEWSVNEV